MELTLDHDETGHRYRLLRDGTEVSHADYRVTDGGATLVFHHTLTHPAEREQGFAGELVGRALDDVRSAGRKVVPTCWFVAEFIESHPAYQDLLA